MLYRVAANLEGTIHQGDLREDWLIATMPSSVSVSMDTQHRALT